MIATVDTMSAVEKLPTGIEGFDLLAEGGLPKGRTTLLAGTSGSAKTVFGCQYLATGLEQFGEAAVFVTFEETPDDIRRNMKSLGWDIEAHERQGRWAFVDASPDPAVEVIESGRYDLNALLVRVENAVRKVDARRLVIDSVASIFSRFTDPSLVRTELFRLAASIKCMNVTALLTAERIDEYGGIARFGVEEFVADNVIIVRNVLQTEQRRRTMEILKFRGTTHKKGEYPFSIISGRGVVLLPLASMELKAKSSDVRITSGVKELDAMCGGGLFRDSILLISGASGAGKTLLMSEFVAGGVANGERCLVFAFEESRGQLFRNAAAWGKDFEKWEEAGLLRVVCVYPETSSLEEHLVFVREQIEEFKPSRVAVDSLSAVERVAPERNFREFVIGMTAYIKNCEIAGLYTSTTPTLMGGTSVTEANISTLTDSIILLRYVELWGELRRGMTVLKMRGSRHDKSIREYQIDGTGMHVGEPFRNVTGILSGTTSAIAPKGELELVEEMFEGKD